MKLTEEMIIARTKSSNLSAIKKLNCWGSDLTDVSILRRLENIEVLSLSVNKIATLSGLQNCRNLIELYVRRNEIRDLSEICYLQDLPRLKRLLLQENPCVETAGDLYRLTVIRCLPNLEKLDNAGVESHEVDEAFRRGLILQHPLVKKEYSPEPMNYGSETPPNGGSPGSRRMGGQYDEDTSGFVPSNRLARSPPPEFPMYQNAEGAKSPGLSSTKSAPNATTSTSTPVSAPAASTSVTSAAATTTATTVTNIIEKVEPYHDNDDDDGQQGTSSNGNPHCNSNNTDRDEDDDTCSPHANPNASTSSTNQNGEPVQRRNAGGSPEYYQRSPQEQVVMRPRRMSSDYGSEGGGNLRNSYYGEPAYYDDGPPPPPHQPQQPQRVPQSRPSSSHQHIMTKPRSRTSNLLSAVLCLIPELDWASLEVVDVAVRRRMDELDPD